MNDNDLNKHFYTVEEFAATLALHPNTVYNCIKKGRINAFRIGGGKKSAYRIPATEIQRLAFIDMKEVICKIVNQETLTPTEN